MTQPAFNQVREVDDIEHYGVVGMKWGKTTGGKTTVSVGRTQGSLNREAKNTNIKTARTNQKVGAKELKDLHQQRLTASSTKGKAKLDSLIADKTFMLKNGADATLAKQKTTGEKWMKAGGTTAKVALTVVGLGGIASVATSAAQGLASMSNEDSDKLLTEMGADTGAIRSFLKDDLGWEES